MLGVVVACVSLVLPKHAKGTKEPQKIEATTPQEVLGVGELAPKPAEVERLYKEWQIEQSRKKRPATGNFCSCVLYAKSVTGYSGSVGNARNWPKNGSPVVGGVVITNESWAGHVAVITAVYPDRIEVIEANYYRCKKSTRTISLSNPIILGFWSP